jgi:DNA-binding MarR family transcriptional regulator
MSNQSLLAFETALHVRDICLCLAAQRAARALARTFDAALQPVGLTNGQFSLLMSLNRPAPPTIGAVAGLLAMDRTTLTANLKPLERRGLLATVVDAEDRRNRLISLTDAGRAVLAAAMPIWTATHAGLDASLGADMVAGLRNGLHAVGTLRRGGPDPAALVSS